MGISGTIQTLSAATLVGDGNGDVDRYNLQPDDITFIITHDTGTSEDNIAQIAGETVKSHIGIGQPGPEHEDRNDALVTVNQLPVPDSLENPQPGEIDIEIVIEQSRAISSKPPSSTACPRCGAEHPHPEKTLTTTICRSCGKRYQLDPESE